MVERLGRTIESRTKKSIEVLHEEALQSGSVNLEGLDRGERTQLLEWFLTEVETVEDRLGWTEQFILHETITDAQLLPVIESFSHLERKAVGIAIGESQKPDQYVQAFYDCWGSLGARESTPWVPEHKPKRDAKKRLRKSMEREKQEESSWRQTFIQRFTVDQPELGIMVAPFVNLRGVVKKYDDGSPSTSLFKQFQTQDKWTELFSATLTLYARRLPKDPSFTDATFSKKPSYGEKTRGIRLETSAEKVLVTPFIEQIRALGLADDPFEKQLTEIFEHFFYFNPEANLLTQEEVQTMNRLRGEIKSKEEGWTSLAYSTPRRSVMELDTYSELASARAAALIAERWDIDTHTSVELIHKFASEWTNVLRYPEKIFRDGAHMMEIVKQLILDDAQTLLESEQIVARLMDFAREQGVDAALETEIVDAMTNLLRSKGISDKLEQRLILRMDAWKEVLSEEAYGQVIGVLNAEIPYVWAINIEAGMANGASLRSIMTHAIESLQNYDLLNQYAFFRHHVVETGNLESPPLSLNEFNEAFSVVFDRWPHILGSRIGRQTANELFSADEYARRLDLYVRNLPPTRISGLFEEQHRELFPRLVDKLRDDPSLLVQHYRAIAKSDYFLEALTAEEFTNAFIQFSTVEQLKSYLTLPESIRSFASQDGPERIKERFTHDGDLSSLSALVLLLKEVSSARARTLEEKELQSEIDGLTRSLSFVADSYRVAFHRSYYSGWGRGNYILSDAQVAEHRAKIDQDIRDMQRKRAFAYRMLERLTAQRDAFGLSAQERSAFDGTIADMVETIEKECAQNFGRVFEGDIVKNPHLDVETYVRRDLDAYLLQNPGELLRRKSYRQSYYFELLGEEAFLTRIQRHGVELAFTHTYRTLPLPSTVKNHLDSLNPVEGLLVKDLEQDYYTMILDRVRHSPFFPLYEKKLSAIAEREQETHGSQTDASALRPDHQFTAFAERLLILQHSESIARYESELLSFEEADLRLVLEAAEFFLMRGLEEELGLVLESLRDPEAILRELRTRVVEHLVPVFGIEDLNETVFDDLSLSSLRGLVTYHSTRVKQTPELAAPMRRMVQKALEGSYASWRAWGTDAEPMDPMAKQDALASMQKEGLVPTGMTLEQYEAWNADMEADFEGVLQYTIKDLQHGVMDILSDAIADQHVEAHELELDVRVLKQQEAKLTAPMKALVEQKQRLDERFAQVRVAKKRKEAFDPITDEESAEHRRLKDEIRAYRQAHGTEIDLVQARMYLSTLRTITSAELEKGVLEVDGRDVPLSKVFKLMSKTLAHAHPNFRQDLVRIEDAVLSARHAMFGDARVSKTQLSLTDTVDLEAYLFIGERPVPSCQSYNGGSMNGGLLAFLTDPNVRIIQMYDSTGRMIARSAVRLLQDANEQPQLFMERVYSTNAHEKIKEAMVGLALKKAQRMGVRLFTNEVHVDLKKTDEAIPLEQSQGAVTLQSRGTRSSEIYTDAGGGRRIGGEFAIVPSKELHTRVAPAS